MPSHPARTETDVLCQEMNRVIDIQSGKINTAGAYVYIDGLYLFALGTRLHNGHIPVFRLGGHRDAQETGWQCAIREVYEETRLQIKPFSSPTTYLADGERLEAELQEVRWQREEYAPLLVVAYPRENGIVLSLMYFAQAETPPRPSAEVKGLLLLKEEDVHRLCRDNQTLEQYLRTGGRAILNHDFDTRLILEPFAQLRLLSRILSIEPDTKLA